ncbi:phosphodiester glycosidase family protein [Kineococcus sp. SYSU DK018]|uniref:phosphodiester glycosidase family protein n=1 Tax=Kineococcus sp. SYSU DK018 TaxID=3383139 RepID=UPI003D7E86D7
MIAPLHGPRHRAALALAGLALAPALLAGPAAAPADARSHPPAPPTATSALSTEQLAPGVTHTALELGDADVRLPWTVQLTLPSPGPAAAPSPVVPAGLAEDAAARLRGAGLEARAEAVVSPRLADAGGYLGHRVRVGSFGTQEAAEQALAQVRATGATAGTWYTGWDGPRPGEERGDAPLRVHVLTVDPRTFRGEVDAVFGPDLERTETTSELARGAVAAVNGGFFVFGDEHGAPGDPAGAGAYDGRVLSETVGRRPALVVDGRTGRARVERLTWEGRAESRGRSIALDGVDRVPGLVRNCGGTGDTPTDAPRHDATCTDDAETVAFTPEFGTTTPAGDGVEVVLDRRGRVTDVRSPRGTALSRGQVSLQATGAAAEELRGFAATAGHVRLVNRYRDERGCVLPVTPHTQVVNGGPQLVRDGEAAVTAARDGMVRADDPGFFHGWVHQRNPRTFAGVDGQGRLVLVTADGRQTGSVGLSIAEAADLALRLGLRDAVNLDGGGSTTAVVRGQVVNSPSGGRERAVGDALVVRAG